MKGRRFVIRMWRRSATSLRFCSRACRSCFMRRPESVRRPPNRGAVDRDAMGLGRVQHELIECDPALRANTGLDPIRHSHARRRHCPEVVGAAVPSHAVVSPGHSRISEKPPRMPGRLTVTVLRVDICSNSLPQFHRVWLARLDPPYPPQHKENHISGNPGILNLIHSNKL